VTAFAIVIPSFSLVAVAEHVCPAGIVFTSIFPTGTANGTVT
jgi:hypothetical protein